MEVILLKKVANLGKIGDRVKVKAGYGRNFLVPSGQATLVTAANVARFEAQRAEFEKNAAADLEDAERRSISLRDYKLIISAKAGSEGKLFGSIGTSDIAEALTKAGYPVERSEVRMPTGPIRTVGEQLLTIHFHTDVDVEISVTVVAEE